MSLIKKNPLISILTIICIVLAILTTFNYSLYDVFAYSSKPNYIWRYLSGAFMHGNYIAPVWFLWVHLLLNLLMIIPLGGVVEREMGTFKASIIFLVAWFISSILFKCLFWNVEETATGISAIGYAFAPVAYYHIFKNSRDKSKKMAYGVLLITMVVMLSPWITGWVSFYLHISGVLVGVLLIPYIYKGTCK